MGFQRLFAILLALSTVLVVTPIEVEVGVDGEVAGGEVPVVPATETEKPKAPVDPNCPDRDHIIRCAGKYLDKNKNGKLDRAELEEAIGSLPWYAKGILKILGSVDKMMKKCDVDKDDAISMKYDMDHNTEECLATCFKRRAFKGSFFPDCDL